MFGCVLYFIKKINSTKQKKKKKVGLILICFDKMIKGNYNVNDLIDSNLLYLTIYLYRK